MSRNNFSTQYIYIKLILDSIFYDKMQLYGISGQPSYINNLIRGFFEIQHPKDRNNRLGFIMSVHER